MAVVTTRQLLESGVHFGHQTRRWNPKMKKFIFAERNGIYIIDLQQSLSYIDRAYAFVRETVARGGQILFVERWQPTRYVTLDIDCDGARLRAVADQRASDWRPGAGDPAFAAICGKEG